MTKQEFIDQAALRYAHHEEHQQWSFDQAEKLAAEREKRYGAFDGEPKVDTPEDDPYAVDWSDAPDWANWHAVHGGGGGRWFADKPEPLEAVWMCFHTEYESSTWKGHNPDWRASLRERPKTK